MTFAMSAAAVKGYRGLYLFDTGHARRRQCRSKIGLRRGASLVQTRRSYLQAAPSPHCPAVAIERSLMPNRGPQEAGFARFDHVSQAAASVDEYSPNIA